MPTPFAEVSFIQRTFTDKVFPRTMRVLQREYSHDLVVFTLGNDTGDAGMYKTGTPVLISWGWAPSDIGTFYGYVHHTVPAFSVSDEGTPQQFLRVVCLGASMIFKEPKHFVYSSRTIPSIIREIVDGAKFSADIQDDDTVWDGVVWDGVPAWSFMVGLAKRIGWSFYSMGTEIQFHDRGRELLKGKDNAPVFTHSQNLFLFSTKRGDETPTDAVRANRKVYGLDPRTLQVVSATNAAEISVREQLGFTSVDPVFTAYETDQVVSSVGQASKVLDGLTYANRWHIQAQAKVAGMGRFRQDRMVLLLGLGQQDNGYWYTMGVDHIYDSGEQSYTMEIQLGRDSAGDTGESPSNPGQRIVKQRLDPFGEPVAAPPPTLLVNGNWRSAWTAQRQVIGV